MRKHCKCILLCLCFFIVGFFVGIISKFGLWSLIDPTKKAGLWEVINYVFSSLGAIGTCAAVVVALGKESILRYFSHPNVEIGLVDEDGISEDIDSEQQTPQASCYNCVLRVKNSGSAQAKTCFAAIEHIRYADRKGKTLREIKDYQNNNTQLTWEGEGVDLPKGISKEIRLFYIDAPGSSVTPGEQHQDIPLLEINGFKLKDNQSKKGVWEILYYISYDSGEHIRFKLSIDWDGTWKSRKTEMKEVLKVKLEMQ